MPEGSAQPEVPDVLSQSEVEKLLAQVSEQQNEVVVLKGEEKETKNKGSIQPYDFRHPVFLSASELRKLRLRHEEFIRALAARLSLYLRLEFSLQMSKLQTIPYQKFTEALPNPTHLSLFKVEPLRGIGILDIHPRLGLTIVDRLLGGPAHSIAADHDFSEIEMALIDQAVNLILAEWCNHWSAIQEIRPVLLGHETNGTFLQTAAHDTILLVLTMEAKFGDCLEQMQIALPCTALEPLIRKMGALTEMTDDTAPDREACRWNRQFDDVVVPVTAVWNEIELSARDLTQLKPGDILPLTEDSTQRVRLRLADMTKFEGQLGTVGGKWAISITGRAAVTD